MNKTLDISKFEIFNDPLFRFEEDTHTYTYHCEETGKSIQTFKSVSGFADNFKDPFEGRKIAENLSPSNPLYGLPVDDILKEWKLNGQRAANLGTEVHEWIENFYKHKVESKTSSDEVQLRVDNFKQYYQQRLSSLKSVFQEKKVFSRKWGYAGTVDAIFELNGEYMIGDYKTNKAFTTDSDFKGTMKKMNPPFQDVWLNKHNEYSMQVSLYRLIIEEETGLELSDSFLLWIPKDGCKIYKAIDYRDRIRNYLNKINLII
jgi:ATP-dependent exoDNAse (exonuclease V) beta subunit